MFISRRTLLPIAAAALAIAAVALIACGGDDDISTGSDEDYVLAACNAQNEFFEELFASLFTDEELTEEEQLELFEGPAKALRDAIADSRPPEDAVEYHRLLLVGMDELLDAIDDGDVDVLETFDFNPDEAMSGSTRARLGALAAGMSECDDLGNPFDSEE